MPWIRDKNPSDFLPPMSPGEWERKMVIFSCK
jgi:hypothetical protein